MSCARYTAAVYTSRVRGRVRAMYTTEDVRTVIYTGGLRAVYTARPLYGRVQAVFVGEDVFTGRVTCRAAAV